MSGSLVQPYLMFGGRCEEAIEFYRGAIEAETEMLMRFNEAPQPVPPGALAPGFEKKVMHASFRVGKTSIMCSDGCGAGAEFKGFSLAITLPTEADADRMFNALSNGGQVTMPLSKTFWSPKFGMVNDKFGISWMVSVEAEKQ